ncbi:MAG: MvaI/BcnI family restriction endonuclease [Thermoplasmatales archaeon]
MTNPIYTKQELIRKLIEIRDLGWVQNRRPNNAGGIGNTIEDLLGIAENNLPLPNSAEWELKCHRASSGSLTTLFHSEPSPRALNIVPSMLLPKYGWKHEKAGIIYPESEMSFRQTINSLSRTDRGFGVVVDRSENKVIVSFDSSKVSPRHFDWLESVRKKVGDVDELRPQPYWGITDLVHVAGTKLLNCFYISADVKKESGKEFYNYTSIKMLKRFSEDKFIEGIENGLVLVDFDARTGHNHGTKFRIREDKIPELYEDVTVI